jgi:hypothetical protein
MVIEPNSESVDIYTDDDLKKRDELKVLLTETFEGTVLFDLYKKKGELHFLFTDKILSMDINTLYSTQDVAEFCETAVHNINNKRREFVDYVSPTFVGDGRTSKNWRHDYKAIFKLKMIDGLTGSNGEYTIPQLKKILSGEYSDAMNSKSSSSAVTFDEIAKFYQALKDEFTTGVMEENVRSIIKEEMPNYLGVQLKKIVEQEVRSHLMALPDPNDETKLLRKDLEVLKEQQVTKSSVEQLAGELASVKKKHEEELELVKNTYEIELREKLFLSFNTRQRIESKLRKQAIDLWEKKPISDRFLTSLFGLRRVEKLAERDQFILDFINSHYEEEIKKE